LTAVLRGQFARTLLTSLTICQKHLVTILHSI
jgi:hypothetical protein